MYLASARRLSKNLKTTFVFRFSQMYKIYFAPLINSDIRNRLSMKSSFAAKSASEIFLDYSQKMEDNLSSSWGGSGAKNIIFRA